jgi:hypothetical protein
MVGTPYRFMARSGLIAYWLTAAFNEALTVGIRKGNSSGLTGEDR